MRDLVNLDLALPGCRARRRDGAPKSRYFASLCWEQYAQIVEADQRLISAAATPRSSPRAMIDKHVSKPAHASPHDEGGWPRDSASLDFDSWTFWTRRIEEGISGWPARIVRFLAHGLAGQLLILSSSPGPEGPGVESRGDARGRAAGRPRREGARSVSLGSLPHVLVSIDRLGEDLGVAQPDQLLIGLDDLCVVLPAQRRLK